MFDIAGKLASLPLAPAEMFALHQEVIEAWWSSIGDLDGCTSQELIEAERRVGVPLPGPLRAILSLYGGREDLMGLQDPLLAPGALRVEDGTLVFQEENQHCVLWGVAVERLEDPDPPVVFQDSNAAGDGSWRPYQERLSVHLFESSLNELMIASKNSVFREADDDSVEVISNSLVRVGIPDHVFWAEPEGEPVKWFAGIELLVRIDGGAMLWACARSAKRLEIVRNLVPRGWETPDS